MKERKRGAPFEPDDEVFGYRVLRATEAERLKNYRYRVLAMECGHEQTLSHSSLTQKFRQKSAGYCSTCIRKRNGLRMHEDTQNTIKSSGLKGALQPHPDKELHEWAHSVWARPNAT